ncbi:MAG TPA: NADH-quinone oxidoreductase subunit J [Dehalococcoidales bacterium]|nr:NADH-quinone oxidoreductase subunit J [Dehalococcoidales bacterium]
MALTIGFWLLAVVSIVAALMVVMLKDIFRAALALVLALVAVAGIYITLQSDFLAGVQILVYIGAIAVLLIIGIMLTRGVQQGAAPGKFRVAAFVVSIFFFAMLCFVFLWTPWKISAAPPPQQTSAIIGNTLFGTNGFLITVEISGVLLLAAIIGAIALAREK